MELQNDDGRRKTRRSSPPSQNPELSEEIIVEEILVRAASCLSSPWCGSSLSARPGAPPSRIPSSSARTSATLQSNGSRTRESRLSTFSNQFRFYQWHHLQGNGGGTASSKQTATLIYTNDLSGGEVISQLGYLAFCDGLVLVCTDTKLYLFNPATRDASRCRTISATIWRENQAAIL
ncbi:unnamed protein product [Miscanthus lutarioriparius]|uniref:Uncharacterized protein n=1 Tax=Miscanthus lutarioriparius TaxID=422564 RepID=A0A811MKS5_9POAL|nr:unnamed protein product [Miscanthus lutarioriparius]